MLCLVTQSCPNLFNSMDSSPPVSSVHGDPPGKNTRVGSHDLLQGNLPNPGVEPTSPALQVYSLLSEPPGKPSRAILDSSQCDCQCYTSTAQNDRMRGKVLSGAHLNVA